MGETPEHDEVRRGFPKHGRLIVYIRVGEDLDSLTKTFWDD